MVRAWATEHDGVDGQRFRIAGEASGIDGVGAVEEGSGHLTQPGADDVGIFAVGLALRVEVDAERLGGRVVSGLVRGIPNALKRELVETRVGDLDLGRTSFPGGRSARLER